MRYSDETESELAIFRAARTAHLRYGAGAIRQCIISKTDELSDLLGALEEARFTPEAFPDASSLAEWAQALVAKLPEKAA